MSDDHKIEILRLRAEGLPLHEIVAATGLTFSEVYAVVSSAAAEADEAADVEEAADPDSEEEDDEDEDDGDDEPETTVSVPECERRQRLRDEREAVVRTRPRFYGAASLPSRDRRTTAFPEDWEQSEIAFARASGDTLSELARRYNLPSWVIKEILSARGVR
jgi:hypothetical protein